MTPSQALEVLNQAAAQVPGVRQFHEQTVAAVNILLAFLQDHEEVVSEVPDDVLANTDGQSEEATPQESTETPVEGEVVAE